MLGSEKPAEPEYSPRELSKEIARVTKLVEDVENQVSRNEAALKDLESQLANLPSTADVFALTQDHQRLQEALEGAIGSWEEHSARLERLQALRG